MYLGRRLSFLSHTSDLNVNGGRSTSWFVDPWVSWWRISCFSFIVSLECENGNKSLKRNMSSFSYMVLLTCMSFFNWLFQRKIKGQSSFWVKKKSGTPFFFHQPRRLRKTVQRFKDCLRISPFFLVTVPSSLMFHSVDLISTNEPFVKRMYFHWCFPSGPLMGCRTKTKIGGDRKQYFFYIFILLEFVTWFLDLVRFVSYRTDMFLPRS